MNFFVDQSPEPKSTADILPDDHHLITANHSRSSSDSFFEFRTGVDHNNNATSFAAVDVILDGRILPYAAPPQPPQVFRPRRSFSLSSAVTRSESSLTRSSSSAAIRPSLSLNCRRLRRGSDTKNEERSSSSSSSSSLLLMYSRSSSSNRMNNSGNIMKSPWYNWLNFGIPMKIPAEIELKELKFRQLRRNIPPFRLFSGDRSNDGCRTSPATWRFLSVLSCKSHTSVDVANTSSVFR